MSQRGNTNSEATYSIRVASEQAPSKRFINQVPSRLGKLGLGLLPFILLVLLYVATSNSRLASNPSDKLLPALSTMQDSMQRMAFEPSKRSGQYLFWSDTTSSLKRLGMGVGIAALVGLIWGLTTGGLPIVGATLSPLLTVLSLVPMLALLPILFIVFGLGELSKVMLITLGITPFIARDVQNRTREIPAEQLIKAQTLGASTSQIIFSVLLPQIIPRLITAVRLSLGAGWLFLIAAEAIASTDGLGYRIFLVRRYLSMDIIIPYVIWITMLAFLFDFLLRTTNDYFFAWGIEDSKHS